MKRIHFDFLHRSRRRTPYGLILLMLGLAGAVASGWYHSHIESELIEIRRQITSLDGSRSDRLHQIGPSQAADSEDLLERIEEANAVIAHLSIPWNAMFDELEKLTRQEVLLLALQQDGGVDRIRISGASRNFDDLLDYMQGLEDSLGFSNVLLVSHGEYSGGTGQSHAAIQFILTAQWIGHR